MFILTQRWSEVNIRGRKPPVRSSHTACCISGSHPGDPPVVVVVGGLSQSADTLSDVWLLDLAKGIWIEVCFLPCSEVDNIIHPVRASTTQTSCSILFSLLQVNLPTCITRRFRHSAVLFGTRQNLRVLCIFGGRMKYIDFNADNYEIAQVTLLLLSKYPILIVIRPKLVCYIWQCVKCHCDITRLWHL